MDPKVLALFGIPLTVVIGIVYRLGKRAGAANISKELEQLHQDLEVAHKTPDPNDDKAIEAKIRAKERLKAMVDSLPDTV